jgi:aquaporin related protein
MTFRYSSLFDNFRDDCAAAAFEFVGTAFFLLFGLGGIQAAAADVTTAGRQASGVEQTLYIATSMGMSLLVSAWLFFRVTGGLFNPNVSLALLLIGSMGPVRFVLYCIAQLAGAIAASAIVRSLTSAPLSVKYVKPTVPNLQPLNVHMCSISTFLQQGTNSAQGVFIEMFITAALVISVLMLAAEKHQTTPFAPVSLR